MNMTDHSQPIPLAPHHNGAEGRPGINPACPCAGSPTNRRWNDETIGELKRLYDLTGDDKLPMSQIADRLSSVDHRITRNAVVGQVHRLGLPKRGAAPNWRPGRYPAERKSRVLVRRLPHAPPVAPVPIVVEALPAEIGGRVGTYMLGELTDCMCHFVIGNGDGSYCGVKSQSFEVLGVGPYCDPHLKRVYQVRPAWVGRR